MPESQHVVGLEALQRELMTFTPRIQKNTIRAALRAGAKVFLDGARQNLARPHANKWANPFSRGKFLSDSLRISTRARGNEASAEMKTSYFIARFLEFGTAPHVIRAQGGGYLHFGSVTTKMVVHPGAQKRPFMRPAFDAGGPAAELAVAQKIREKLISQGSLNLPEPRLAGDE